MGLVVYTAVIVGSGVLAAWYLRLAPGTRLFRARSFEPSNTTGA